MAVTAPIVAAWGACEPEATGGLGHTRGPMAALYGPHYERIWRDALLLPGHHDLLASLASEVADHVGEDVDATVDRMRSAFLGRGELAARRFPGATPDASRLVEYYSDATG